MSITFNDAKDARCYKDAGGNIIGWAKYDAEKCVFRLDMNVDYCDGVGDKLDGVEALSMAPLDQLAYAASLMADAAGY